MPALERVVALSAVLDAVRAHAHLWLALAFVPLALIGQLRTRRLNLAALLLSPVVYAVLAGLAARQGLAAGLPLGAPLLLLAASGALGVAQGVLARVYYDPERRDYIQRGGIGPLIFWAAAVALRQLAVPWLVGGLPAAGVGAAQGLSVDVVLLGLLSGRVSALWYRHRDIGRAAVAQLWSDAGVPPPRSKDGG